MTPTLNISHTTSYEDNLSDKLAISGATNPGVPHLEKIYGASVCTAAKPKSAIYKIYDFPFYANNIFSGFKSLCITF